MESVLTRKTIATYAVGSVGTGGFGTLPGLVLLAYMTDNLGIAAAAAGALITVAKVWDVIIDPVIGARSDRSLALRGTRRPAMILGALALPVFFVLTFAVPAGIGPVASGVWVLIAFLITATAFSLFQVPYIALPAELTDQYDARTRLISARVVVLTLAILLFGAGAPEIQKAFENSYTGYLVMAIVAGLVIGGGLFIASFVAKRRDPVPAEPFSIADNYRAGFAALRRSQPFRSLLATFLLQGLATGLMLAGAVYLANHVIPGGSVTFIFISLVAPAILFAPVWAIISRRIGKERTFIVASVLFGIATLVMALLLVAPGQWVYAPIALAGIGYAGMQSLPLSMLPDVISHDAGRHGQGAAGSFGGVWTAGETTGIALGTTVLGIVLSASGYIESVGGVDVQQPASAVTGIALSFSIVPAVIIALSLVTFSRYPLRKADIDAAR
ncbi:MAG: MFS transporter [Actinobacteria bacterium]|nr:MFS transporter [Actinomycetota bacterium]